jgi:hypothetical protein
MKRIQKSGVSCQLLSVMGFCPDKNTFERSLKLFLLINLGEAEDKRFQLFEPIGRVLKSPEASLRFIKKCFQTKRKGIFVWAKACNLFITLIPVI